jgi:hypothetical protein
MTTKALTKQLTEAEIHVARGRGANQSLIGKLQETDNKLDRTAFLSGDFDGFRLTFS